MLKLFLGAMGGVFVGALVVEILRHKKPETVDKIEKKARLVIGRVGLPENCEAEIELQTAE